MIAPPPPPRQPSQHSISHPSKISAMLAGQPASAAPAPQSGIGAMLSDPAYQPPAAAPVAAPPAPPPQAMPPRPRSTGREMSDAIAQQAAQMTPQQKAAGEQRADYLVSIFGTLAKKPNLQLKDVYDMARQSIADGKASPDEVNSELAGLPSNPQQLRVAMQQRFKAAIISASILSGSQQQASLQGAPAGQAAPQPQMTMPAVGAP